MFSPSDHGSLGEDMIHIIGQSGLPVHGYGLNVELIMVMVMVMVDVQHTRGTADIALDVWKTWGK
jgi:hypothetical protein